MIIDLDELSHLSEVFKHLRKGRHLCEDDGPPFYALHARYNSYAALFKALGFDLVKHDRGFYYFQSEAELGKEAAQLAVFFFILVEAWSDAGLDIEATAFDPKGHRYSKLPHRSRESWQQCMAEVEAEKDGHINDLLRRMKSCGFTEQIDEETFRFRTPAWRFLDLCHEIREEAVASTRTPMDSATAQNQEKA